ncbi:hypothetical protein N7495_009117 [Penicillium taxi]|uniref:uncharacterized protein n=1 Tax=Penicillium taxi TaxID=168475 RepID=UPI002545147B|nr:uncharacterized protein N7495_009117 [Penicillium taxi]KAJ5889076.1 hypothetical protein N7495_009117 [Penicillium taxi]
MMVTWKSLLLAVLIGLSTATPTQNIIIGYRTAQAAIYTEAKTLVWSQPRGGQQLGAGVYLTPNLGGWPGVEGDWYCVIFAQRTEFDKISKAWIPEYNACEEKLWFSRGDLIDEEITSLGAKSADTTVRLSKLFGKKYQHIKQIVLPEKLLDHTTENGKKVSPLGISVKCGAFMSELPNVDVSIDTWPKTLGKAQ